jgi:hypothetical protein
MRGAVHESGGREGWEQKGWPVRVCAPAGAKVAFSLADREGCVMAQPNRGRLTQQMPSSRACAQAHALRAREREPEAPRVCAGGESARCPPFFFSFRPSSLCRAFLCRPLSSTPSKTTHRSNV